MVVAFGAVPFGAVPFGAVACGAVPFGDVAFGDVAFGIVVLGMVVAFGTVAFGAGTLDVVVTFVLLGDAVVCGEDVKFAFGDAVPPLGTAEVPLVPIVVTTVCGLLLGVPGGGTFVAGTFDGAGDDGGVALEGAGGESVVGTEDAVTGAVATWQRNTNES